MSDENTCENLVRGPPFFMSSGRLITRHEEKQLTLYILRFILFSWSNGMGIMIIISQFIPTLSLFKSVSKAVVKYVMLEDLKYKQKY